MIFANYSMFMFDYLSKKLSVFIHPYSTWIKIINASLRESEERIAFDQRRVLLTDSILHSTEMGVAGNNLFEEEVIVSLTTYGKRLYDVHLAIESIMQGTVLPNRIVLWISEEFKNKSLPLYLQLQMKRGLEVMFCKDIRSYTKLIPSLKQYPNSVIITIDDDIIYPSDVVENLLRTHRLCPGAICANRVIPIPKMDEASYLPLLKWKDKCSPDNPPRLLFFEGFGGVLYPPKSLHEEVLDESIFLDICRTADDVWFNAMAIKKGTAVVYANPHINEVRCLVNAAVQDCALKNLNSLGEVLNDKQIKKVFSRYSIWENLK